MIHKVPQGAGGISEAFAVNVAPSRESLCLSGEAMVLKHSEEFCVVIEVVWYVVGCPRAGFAPHEHDN